MLCIFKTVMQEIAAHGTEEIKIRIWWHDSYTRFVLVDIIRCAIFKTPYAYIYKIDEVSGND